MKKRQRPLPLKAFSLVEMSIVVIIISMLITGIIKGSGLVRSSRLATARSYTSKSIVPESGSLVAWYETSMMDSFDKNDSVDEKNLTSWFDLSPSSNAGLSKKNTLTKTADNGAKYVIDGINHLPSISFNGTSNFSLSNFFQGSSNQNTILIVFRPTAIVNSATQVLLDSHNSGGSSSLGIRNNSININAGLSINTATSTNPATIETETDYILCAYLNGSSSQFYLNDANNKIGDSLINIGNNSLKGLTVGSNKIGSSAFSGMISEIIIYNSVLELQARKDIMSYLGKKYKINVSGI